MNIVEIAERYFPLVQNNNTYRINRQDGKMDSVVIFPDTNSFCRFSLGKDGSGGVHHFLKTIVGLSENEIEEQYGGKVEPKELTLADVLQRGKRTNKVKSTGLSLQDVAGKQSYSTYMNQRMINEYTASYFGLESDGDDVLIPLYNNKMRRVGSQRRFAKAKTKGDRYRTYMVGSHDKPCCWDMVSLQQLTPDSVVVFVEGAWSMMRIHQVVKPLFPNVLPICTLGATLQEELFAYTYSNQIIAIMDDDEGGKAMYASLSKWTKQGCKVETIYPKCKGKTVYVDDLNDTMLIELFKQIM